MTLDIPTVLYMLFTITSQRRCGSHRRCTQVLPCNTNAIQGSHQHVFVHTCTHIVPAFSHFISHAHPRAHHVSHPHHTAWRWVSTFPCHHKGMQRLPTLKRSDRNRPRGQRHRQGSWMSSLTFMWHEDSHGNVPKGWGREVYQGWVYQGFDVYTPTLDVCIHSGCAHPP